MSNKYKTRDRFILEISEALETKYILKNGMEMKEEELDKLPRFEQKGAYKEGYNEGLNVKAEEEYLKGMTDITTKILLILQAPIQEMQELFEIPNEIVTQSDIVSYILSNYTPEEIIFKMEK